MLTNTAAQLGKELSDDSNAIDLPFYFISSKKCKTIFFFINPFI